LIRLALRIRIASLAAMKFAALAACVLLSPFTARDAIAAASEHTAPPERRIYEKISSLQMKAILGRAGYEKIEIDGDDDISITMHDYKVWVFVKGNEYRNIQLRFAIRGNASLELINKWNRDRSYTKAYLNKDENPVLEMDIELTGGVTEERIKLGIATFSVGLEAFLKELG
jgi:hypothetical protein